MVLVLGGDGLAFVYADANLDAAAADIVGPKLANVEEIRVSPNGMLGKAEVYTMLLA